MQANLNPYAILPQLITRTIVLYRYQIGSTKHLVLQIFFFVHLGDALIAFNLVTILMGLMVIILILPR